MDSIEGIKIECDEDGFHLVIAGDFVESFTRYLENDDDACVELLLPQNVAIKLAGEETKQIREWWAEGLAAAASYVSGVMVGKEWHEDFESGYDLNDPKHPTFHDRYSGEADALRKREREQRADWINPPGRS